MDCASLVLTKANIIGQQRLSQLKHYLTTVHKGVLLHMSKQIYNGYLQLEILSVVSFDRSSSDIPRLLFSLATTYWPPTLATSSFTLCLLQRLVLRGCSSAGRYKRRSGVDAAITYSHLGCVPSSSTSSDWSISGWSVG